MVRTDTGETPRRQDVLRRLKRLLRKLGLQERSFHSLRHSFLTRLVRRGASVEAVRMLAGHSSLLVTERYVHATASDLHRAISLLRKTGWGRPDELGAGWATAPLVSRFALVTRLCMGRVRQSSRGGGI